MGNVTIGIDPGTRCGWAVLDEDGRRVGSGTWDLASRRHEGGGMRYVRAESYLGELLETYPAARVGYEEVRRHVGTDAAHVYGGIVATIQRVCEGLGVPYRGVPVASVKKGATGKGNAGKADMVAAAAKRWPKGEPYGEDEADALWIADALRVELGGARVAS